MNAGAVTIGGRWAVAKPVVAMVAASIVVLGSATAVMAAGSEALVIEGPGLDEPVEIDFGDPPPSLAMGQFELAVQLGARFNSRAGDIGRLEREAPTDDLGPRWTVTWIAGGPATASREERSTEQVVYPGAAGGPVVHTPATSGLVDGNVGWYRAPPELRDTLRSLGVPIGRDDSSEWTAPVLVLAVMSLALLVLWRVAVAGTRKGARDRLSQGRGAE